MRRPAGCKSRAPAIVFAFATFLGASVAIAAQAGAAGARWSAATGAHGCSAKDGTYCNGTVSLSYGGEALIFTPAECRLGATSLYLRSGDNLSSGAKWFVLEAKVARGSTSTRSLVATWNLGPHEMDYLQSPKLTYTLSRKSGTVSGEDDIHHDPLRGSFKCR